MKSLFSAGGKCAVANQFTGDQCLSPIATCDTNQVRSQPMRYQLIVVKIPPDKTLIPYWLVLVRYQLIVVETRDSAIPNFDIN